MPYYPPRADREEDRPEGQGRGTQEPGSVDKSRRTARMIRAGIICLSAALILYGGVRLISYTMELSASRKTRDELKAAMLEAGESPAPSAGTGASAPDEGSGETAVPAEAAVAEAGAAGSLPEATASGAAGSIDEATASEAAAPSPEAEGPKGDPDRLPALEYENGYRVVPSIQKLRQKSSYVMGWLQMDDLEEPVAQKDNTFFLDHDAMGKKNYNGAIFLDESVSLLPRPYTFLLYGHNMKSGNMFGNLHKYRSHPYCSAHSTIRFDTLFEEGTYTVFAVSEICTLPGGRNYVSLAGLQSSSREERARALEALTRCSEYTSIVDVNEEDRLLLLVTCVQDDRNRLVVAARKLREGEAADRLQVRHN